MKNLCSLSLFLLFIAFSCGDDHAIMPESHFPESTTAVPGKAVVKVLEHPAGWVSLQETLQPQYLVTQPKRELVWRTAEFTATAGYVAPEGWSLIDAAVHPSGQVSAAVVNLDLKRDPLLEIKILRLENGISKSELLLQPLPVPGEPAKFFPASLDRIKLEACGEDLYVVARHDYNQVEASRFSYGNGAFHLRWQTLVEPEAYAGSTGIIGGGYDNFHQGDRYFFVYSGVDAQGNLYVAAPSHEDLVYTHDERFDENLMDETNPDAYDWGIAIVTKLSSSGERKYSRLRGMSTAKRLINMKVSEGNIYLVGRVKKSSESAGWDAWALSMDASTGSVRYEREIDIDQGDMFWDISASNDGNAIAVGTTAYTQNPGGLSVSDARLGMAVLLDNQGNVTGAIEIPQGPSTRGSEAMFVGMLDNNSVLVAGVHNAPGTHADVYCDGFIAVREVH